MALFTAGEVARQMSAKGRLVLAAKREQRRDLEGKLAFLAGKVAELTANSTTLALARLARVRAQLDLLDKRIEEELAKPDCDGQRVDRLANASHRLAEQERVLAGRPLPGSLRPPAGRPAREIQARLIPIGPAPTPQADPPKPAPGTP